MRLSLADLRAERYSTLMEADARGSTSGSASGDGGRNIPGARLSRGRRGDPRPAVVALGLASALSACAPGTVLRGDPASDVPPAFEVGPRPAFALKPGKARELPGKLDVGEAILLALENNREFRVERLDAGRRRTYEGETAAAFDPRLSAELAASEGKSTRSYGPIGPTEIENTSSSGSVGVSRLLPSGTDLGLETSAGRDWSDSGGGLSKARVGVSVTQALLRDGRRDANLAELRRAALDSRASEYELRGLAEALVAEVEKAYWDSSLAERRIAILQDSLEVAERQLAETGERIRVGVLPEADLAAAEAEVAFRVEARVAGRASLDKSKLRLARFLGVGPGRWREIVLAERPSAPDVELSADVASHVATALARRPELGQARLGLKAGELEVVKTANGLLPRLDLFMTLGKSGYASAVGDAVADLDGNSFDLSAGLAFERVLGRRAERARHERALLARSEAEESLRNLEELVELEVRSAYIDVLQRREQVKATAATRAAREEVLRAETAKLQVGKSRGFLVALAQRDLLASRLAEVEAVVDLLKAIVDFHRAEGTLLGWKRIVAPSRRRSRRFGGAGAPEPPASDSDGAQP